MPKSDGTKDGKFWARVEKNPSGCWNWIGSIGTDAGYAQMFWRGKQQLAHRIAWQLQYGEIPDGDFFMNIYFKFIREPKIFIHFQHRN
jgi:hypothetical protein